MEDLKLPIIKDVPSRKRRVSMDDYLRFVTDNIKLVINIEQVRELRKKLSVNVPFIIK